MEDIVLVFILAVMESQALVYIPTKLHPAIVKKMNKEVDKGIYQSKNEAINKGLASFFKIKIPKPLTLGRLSPGDKFTFATSTAYKVYKVIENCKVAKKQRTRKCVDMLTGRIIYSPCTREVLKANYA